MVSQAERLILDADAEAEAWIGAVRIVIALVLVFLFIIVGVEAELPVVDTGPRRLLAGLVIGSWLLLGMASVLLVRSGVYRPWMAWTFGLTDVAIISFNLLISVLMGPTGSMLLLASPAAFLICVLFVLQSFRYRVKLQIVITGLLVASIGGLIFLAPGTGPAVIDPKEFGPIPNFFRLVLLAIVGAATSLAVWRSAGLLHRVARETEIRSNQMRFLPAEFSDRMTDAELARMRAGRLTDLVIMFIDMRGFTALTADLPPQAVADLLGAFRRRISVAVTGEGGIVDKFIGDGALVVFGLNTSPGAAARAALASGERLLDDMAQWNAERRATDAPEIGIVIAAHVGPAIAGAIGDNDRLEFSVVGATVNVASRIETLAKEKNLPFVVSATVLEAAGGERKGWTDLGEQPLRGLPDPMQVFGWQQSPQTLSSPLDQQRMEA